MKFSQKVSLHLLYFVFLFSNFVSVVQILLHLYSTLFPHSSCSSVRIECTGCVSEFGDFATLFFLVQQHWGGCCYRHFAANFKAF
jgi:hypothetical protein